MMNKIENYAKKGKISVGFDFDDTITIRKKGGKHYEIEGFNTSVVELIKKYHAAGLYIVIITARCCENWGNNIEEESKKVKDILKGNNIPFDEIWTGRGKPYVKCYLGDESNFDIKNTEKSCEIFDKMVNEKIISKEELDV